jgi:hypothetical protein
MEGVAGAGWGGKYGHMASTTLTVTTLGTTGNTLAFQALTAGETHNWTDNTTSPGAFVLFRNTAGAVRTVSIPTVLATLPGTPQYPTLTLGAISRDLAAGESWLVQPVPASHRSTAGLSTFTVAGSGLGAGAASGVEACAYRRGL